MPQKEGLNLHRKPCFVGQHEAFSCMLPRDLAQRPAGQAGCYPRSHCRPSKSEPEVATALAGGQLGGRELRRAPCCLRTMAAMQNPAATPTVEAREIVSTLKPPGWILGAPGQLGQPGQSGQRGAVGHSGVGCGFDTHTRTIGPSQANTCRRLQRARDPFTEQLAPVRSRGLAQRDRS